MPTHKKGHDKDKYYHLAKDQGYRSRAAFKLIQINKRFDFLSKAKVCLDLCAAPGGWCQVAAKTMLPGSIIIGIDLLPIRPIRNVKTIVSDITTAECRKIVRSELNGWKADVVLCDGAPNIGASYSKDAYVQNELVLAALKTATDHLVQGGTFCTKVYRSVDYNALIWVFQQLFEDVQAMKPSSSRSQSSEIFIVCMKYTAPKFIDPKLLDPNHVFKEVGDSGNKKVDVLHKKYDQHNKRHRSGYDDDAGILLHSKTTVCDFINSKDPVRLLTDMNAIDFTPECKKYKDHKATNEDIVLALQDLKVLSKTDFKKILRWRHAMREAFPLIKEASVSDLNEDDSENDEESEEERDPQEMLEEKLMALQEKAAASQKKERKKARKEASKERQRQVLGIRNNAFEEDQDQELFSLSKVNEMKDIDIENLDEDIDWSDEQEVKLAKEKENLNGVIIADDTLEDELDEEYDRYMIRRQRRGGDKDEQLGDEALPSRKKQKKEQSSEGRIAKLRDDDMISAENESDNESDIDTDNSDGDSQNSDEEMDEKVNVKEMNNMKEKSDLWFSHPLFKENQDAKEKTASRKRSLDPADEMLQSMPKSEKEIRNEKRRKVLERQERKQLKKKSKLEQEMQDDTEHGDMTVVSSKSKRPTNPDEDDQDEVLDEKTVQYRELISRGMGKAANSFNDGHDDAEVEIVPSASSIPPRVDERLYDSENEDYDENDKAMTLALGTLMLRKSKQKALVDSSYNRYAWNDDKDLPSWFLDDETRHNKPQLPVPQALLTQIKSKFQHVGTNDIKKVAEARARKRKRALAKLKAAKKKASAMADNSEMSQRQKVKVINSKLNIYVKFSLFFSCIFC